MALSSKRRIEVDIIIREYRVDFYDNQGNEIKEPVEKLESEVRQNRFDGIVEALKYLILKI